MPLPSQPEGDFAFSPLCSVCTGAFHIQGLGFAFHVQAVQTGQAAPGELILIHHGKAPSWTWTQLLKFRASEKQGYNPWEPSSASRCIQPGRLNGALPFPVENSSENFQPSPVGPTDKGKTSPVSSPLSHGETQLSSSAEPSLPPMAGTRAAIPEQIDETELEISTLDSYIHRELDKWPNPPFM